MAPGVGGAVITGLQIMATVTSYAVETNPQTVTQYSKFVQDNQGGDEEKMISSMHGMIIIYLPALVVSVALENIFPRRTLASRFVIVHFIKRLLEVIFLHRYSGNVKQNLCMGIGVYYALVSALICRVAQQVTSTTVANVGTAMFGVGIIGNFYHHFLLAKLRMDPKKTDGAKYVAPKGGLFNFVAAPHYFFGLFNFVAAPHYLFELISWLGIAVVSQQMNAYLVFMSMTSYLTGRAV
eukprot:CAMPEP_0176504208 /NCGR_PEP_ID=MMETSP0200_2-20121128/15797_1 /TAXON_ID=947934 /ORGANISM="Chaetoceros sp., Strain GSL56" /LENGTH=237 /DNA_ID=CAMNT_0017903597 /DNA_START=66 /DNA_END=777 /DNA_ORIENTATION=-